MSLRYRVQTSICRQSTTKGHQSVFHADSGSHLPCTQNHCRIDLPWNSLHILETVNRPFCVYGPKRIPFTDTLNHPSFLQSIVCDGHFPIIWGVVLFSIEEVWFLCVRGKYTIWNHPIRAWRIGSICWKRCPCLTPPFHLNFHAASYKWKKHHLWSE